MYTYRIVYIHIHHPSDRKDISGGCPLNSCRTERSHCSLFLDQQLGSLWILPSIRVVFRKLSRQSIKLIDTFSAPRMMQKNVDSEWLPHSDSPIFVESQLKKLWLTLDDSPQLTSLFPHGAGILWMCLSHLQAADGVASSGC